MDVSVSIWCLKKSPSFRSNWDRPPFFDDLDVEEPEDDDAALLPDPAMISDSIHMWARTWQMPSSTSGLNVRYPVMSCSLARNIYVTVPRRQDNRICRQMIYGNWVQTATWMQLFFTEKLALTVVISSHFWSLTSKIEHQQMIWQNHWVRQHWLIKTFPVLETT